MWLMKRLLLYFLVVICAITSTYAREVYLLNNDWKFFFKEENSSDLAREITLPHTWNANAIIDNGSYRQTVANYQRTLLIPAEWKGKRLFLRFNGVQSVADIFLNGRHIGDHYGGYTAFTMEITDKVSYGFDNSLLVVVSNTFRSDVLPTSSEENIYGGIYRDVELIVTESTTISPLYYGTEGILVHQSEVSKERVSGRVDLALIGKKDSSCNITLDFVAPDGYVSLSKSVKAKIDGKIHSVPFAIDNPELWSPSQPRLYTVRATIGNDVVEVSTGFRKIDVTPEKKFTINGRRIRIHGVNLHHDRATVGNALSERDYDADIALIRELGANAVRSTTGPHAQRLYNQCDRLGMVAWIDLPFTRAPFLSDIPYYATPLFEKNGLQQLQEIVLQNINHPSVVMWGVYSLLRGNNKQQLDYIRKLNDTAKRLDSTRPTVACSNQDGDINFITDLIVWQQAVGWQQGEISDLDIWQGALRKNWGHLRQAICYGEGSALGRYGNNFIQLPQQSTRVPESKQWLFHEGYSNLVDEELFWGVWINSMFDFGSARYIRGYRNTGLVATNHTERKDLFYLYKSLWGKRTPTLHIAGKKRDVRSNERQALTIYSSMGRPVLTINGDTVAVENVARTVYRTDTLSLKGHNTVVARVGDKSDEMTLTIGSFLKRK